MKTFDTTKMTLAAGVAVTATILSWIFLQKRQRRQERTQWIDQEKKKVEDVLEDETLPSIIANFSDFQLDYESTISHANQRRTSNYYERARDAHRYDLVVGVRSYLRLRNRREEELQRINKRAVQGTKSHRTIVSMCDSFTAHMLIEAREHILGHLKYSTNVQTRGAWIPEQNLIPEEDLHVTVAIPWWWHTIRPGNKELSEELAARFRQALILEFHHPFQIELERIILLGGKTVVALWRCIGERKMEDGTFIYDRHGEGIDPFGLLMSLLDWSVSLPRLSID